MNRTSIKLLAFGLAFLFLLLQNAILVHQRKLMKQEIVDLKQEVARLERALTESGSASQ